MNRNYSEEQMNYMQAKTLLETARSEYRATRSSEAEEAYNKAIELHSDSRTSLINWAINKCKSLPQFKEYESIVNEVLNSRSPVLRSKMVDLSMSLEA